MDLSLMTERVSNRVLFLAYVLSKHVYDIIETHDLDVSLLLRLIIKLTLLVQRIPKKLTKHDNFLSLHKKHM